MDEEELIALGYLESDHQSDAARWREPALASTIDYRSLVYRDRDHQDDWLIRGPSAARWRRLS